METYILDIMMDNDGDYEFSRPEFCDCRESVENYAWIRHLEFMDRHTDFEQEDSLHHEKEDFLQALRQYGHVVTSDSDCKNRRVYRIIPVTIRLTNY